MPKSRARRHDTNFFKTVFHTLRAFNKKKIVGSIVVSHVTIIEKNGLYYVGESIKSELIRYVLLGFRRLLGYNP